MRFLLRHSSTKPLLAVLLAGPAIWLLFAALTEGLGANPAEYLIRSTGAWVLRFLCVVLLVTPLRIMAGWPELARFRRFFGLTVFYYLVLHLLCYAWFDMGLDAADIAKDVAKRPFILVGMSGGLILLLLAATSFNRAIKALGARNWQRLHRLVYAVAGLGILHFYWMRAGKHNFAQVWLYAAILSSLLAWRLWRFTRVRWFKRN